MLKIIFLARRILSKIYLGKWNNFDNDLRLLNENKEKLSFSPLDIKYISDDANLQKNRRKSLVTKKIKDELSA